MSEEKHTRKQVEEDAKEDLELKVEDADKVGGAQKVEYLKIKLEDATITGL
jgi:hypothetical protein